MTREDLITLLKLDLNLRAVDDARLEQLGQLLDAAVDLIAREGVQLGSPYSYEDGQLVVMYASYLYRKRATAEPMPRMLRWALNNRIFSEKAGGDDATE